MTREERADQTGNNILLEILLTILRTRRWPCPPVPEGDCGPLITLKEWAKSQSISRQRAYQLWKQGRLPGARLTKGRGANGKVVYLPANVSRLPSDNCGGRFAFPTGFSWEALAAGASD